MRRQAKRQSDAALTEARKTGVRMRAEGYTAKAIESIWEVHPNTMFRWESRKREGGEAALSVQRRGHRQGGTAALGSGAGHRPPGDDL